MDNKQSKLDRICRPRGCPCGLENAGLGRDVDLTALDESGLPRAPLSSNVPPQDL